MDARFLKATTVLPYQDKVCGRTLRAFSLRHRVALEAIESPFLKPEGGTFTALDVILAVKILSTHDKCEMVSPLSLMDRFFLLLLGLSRKYRSRVIGRIVGCISASLSYPKFWKKENQSKAKEIERIPFTLSCVSTLTRNGCSLEEAWTMPEGEAVWMTVAHALFNGAKIDVLSTEEEEDLKNFDARIEAYKKANNLS